jgi:superfamily II DNA or RNA helicase
LAASQLEIVIDSHITIRNLSDDWKKGLAHLASIKNESKDRAQRELVWGAKNLPDTISLARIGRKNLILPRGFLADLLEILQDKEIPFDIQDKREYHSGLILNPVDHLRDDQERAVEEIVARSQGRIIAPPGKGKTVIALGAIARLRCPTLIIVEKKHIAQQWADRAKEHLGLELGIIGDNQWVEKPISIATIQTLWSRKEQLDEDNWWKYWSALFLDEQHHIPATTFSEIIQRFPARYRIGLSATKGKSAEKDHVSKLIFGRTLYEDKEVNIKPEIHIVETRFNFDYHPTRKVGRKVVRNNYQKLVTALVTDQARNSLIASTIVKNKDHCNLVLSRRLKHLEILRVMCTQQGIPLSNCYMLTGKEPTDVRMEVYERADSGNCVIFSTVADEAVDIPRIDRIYLTFPAKNPEIIWQQIGRGTREHSDKEHGTIVYDFVDRNVDVTRNQFKTRLRGLYQQRELVVK